MTEPRTDRARNPSPTTIAVSVALLCLLWGSTWVVIREGLRDLPPFTSAGIRFWIAFLVFAALAPTLARREGGKRPPTWLWIVSGSTNFAASYTIVYVCETVLPSGLVAVLWAVFPLMMAFAGHLFLPGERLASRHWTGFALGFLGVVLLYATDVQGFGDAALPLALLLLVSPLVSAIGTALIKRYGEDASSVLLNRNAMGVGALLLTAIGLVAEHDQELHWTGTAIFSVLYLAIMGTVVTFGLYFWLMRYARANRLALIAFVTPVIALFLGWAVGDEAVTPWTLAGTAAIIGGVALVVRRSPDESS